MVVLMEYAPGLAMKRKGAEEPGLFACSGDGDLIDGVPISCRATKIRRLESAGGYHQHDDEVPAAASGGTAGDVMMGEAQGLSPSLGSADENRAVVVLDPDGAARGARLGHWRLVRPCAPLRGAGANNCHGWIRDMLREEDSRTVRAVLSSAQREGADLALVPWGAAVPSLPTMDQVSTAVEVTADEDEEDDQGMAAMEVEEERGHQTSTPGAAGCREGRLYLRPQHCMATPPPLPAVGQASGVMCSW